MVPKLQTVISDNEVETETKQVKSKLYYIKYFNSYTDLELEHIIVATSRSETIFGDIVIGFNTLDTIYNIQHK